MIFLWFTIGLSVVAAACLAGALLKPAKRAVFVWALFSAGVAAVAAVFHSFWTVLVFGLMTVWALVAALPYMTHAWRMRAGLSTAFAIAAAISIYPTYHDEVVCSEENATLPETCPAVIDAMKPEDRAAFAAASESGEAGLQRWLFGNLPYRMVRGLDLKGGLRLVYSVEVAEAINDKRDLYYDDLRSKLTKDYGLVAAEVAPRPEDMKKLDEYLTVRKPRARNDAVEIRFKDPAEAKAKINEKFLTSFIQELDIQREQDGLVTFRIRNEVESRIRERAVSQAKETISRRIDSMGLKEVGISIRDEDVIVEVPRKDEKDFQKIRDIISQTARLEFKMVDDEPDFFKELVQSAAKDKLPKGFNWYQENAPLGSPDGGKSQRTEARWFGRLERLQGETMEEALVRLKAWTATLEIDQDHEIGYMKIYDYDEDNNSFEATAWRTYYLWAKAQLTGDMVRDARALADTGESSMGGWFVNMQFSPRGGEIFERITGENIKRRFAIILDGKVESAPVIQSEIGGGTARITMGGGGLQQQLEDARKLELVLRSGALPAPISPSNEQLIGPSLGEDSIRLGLRAAGIGGVFVLGLMLCFYRRAGIITNIAVVFNLILQITVLSMFSASMTLPGIAGLALTAGMSVDANVLINERIKEELARGKGARSAVAVGYEKAFSAIIDGNATTLISGLILAQYGTGPIKGFAVTLIIGMLTNLFTGVVVTRLFFEFWVRGRRNVKLDIQWSKA